MRLLLSHSNSKESAIEIRVVVATSEQQEVRYSDYPEADLWPNSISEHLMLWHMGNVREAIISLNEAVCKKGPLRGDEKTMW